MLSYAHSAFLTEAFLKRGLKQLGTDYADVLLLGYFSKRPPQRVLDGAMKLKDAGMVRAVGITTHNRSLVPELHAEGILDLYHVRYNAVHRGAEKDLFRMRRWPGCSGSGTSWPAGSRGIGSRLPPPGTDAYVTLRRRRSGPSPFPPSPSPSPGAPL